MVKVLKFNEYDKSEELANEIIESICNPQINESTSIDDSIIKKILKNLSRDLKFNIGLVSTFGAGIKVMYPIIENLINNGSLKIEMTSENIILLCITSLSITYLEETQNKAGDKITQDGVESVVTKSDAQTMLEELKMRGVGNGLVKKFVSAFKSIGSFFKILFRGTPYVITGLIDMFGYTAILIPCMNTISSFIGKYDITVDTVASNLLSVGVGLTAIVAKQGVSWLVGKIKKSLNIKNLGDGLDKPISVMPYEIIDGETENIDKRSKLIKEQ